MYKRIISAEDKIYAVNLYLNGKESQHRIASMFDVSVASVQQWIRNYESLGANAFIVKKYKKYSKDLKQQARSYTVKYETGGVEALRDNRGKRKSPDEMNELEKLRAEVKILKAEKERAEMEASFLKKLDEIERRRG